jgi:antirestriction protein ArdC
MATASRVDIYARVTSRIVEQLEQGARSWMQPWNATHAAGRITRPLRFNAQPYSGINILMLWASAEEQGFISPYWMTFRQAQELNAHVKKGEKGSPVVYANSFKKTETDDAGQEVEHEIPYLKQYTVFCADQIEGLPAPYYQLAEQPKEKIEAIAHAQEFFGNTKADIRTGGNRAFYALEPDYIRVPPIEAFRDAESHAATVAHELTHWTRHQSRLNRDLGRKKWGDEGYAMEELVAEMASAFLCADLQITPEVREDHASYIDNWLKVLKDDKRAVFSAASFASKAVDFLHGLQPKAEN